MDIELGPLKSLEISESWIREDSYARGVRIKFSAGNGLETSFVILAESRSVSVESLSSFHSILRKREGNQESKSRLSGEEVYKIREILGTSSVGDNQHVNRHNAADPKSPAFQMAYAKVINLNNRAVLEVKGQFVDQSGAASNYTRAIFTDWEHARILKVFLQTPSQDEFVLSNRIFASITSSFVWN